MFPLLIPMGIGALGGALLKKKDPLKGALLGAGLGAGAGAAFPAIGGLLGGSAATGAAAGAAATGTAAAGAAAAPGVAAGGAGFGLGAPLVTGGVGSATYAGGAAAAAPEAGLMATLAEYKPALEAAAIGTQMSGLLDQQPEQQAPAPAPMTQGGPETLAAIAGQGAPATVQAGMQERMRRRAMLRGGV